MLVEGIELVVPASDGSDDFCRIGIHTFGRRVAHRPQGRHDGRTLPQGPCRQDAPRPGWPIENGKSGGADASARRPGSGKVVGPGHKEDLQADHHAAAPKN